MKTGKCEALDMFSKYLSEGTLLRCYVRCSTYRAAFVGRIRTVSDDGIRLSSDDCQSELELPLSSDLQYGYGDSRNSPTELPVYDGHLLVFMTRYDPLCQKPDMIAFSEVRAT